MKEEGSEHVLPGRGVCGRGMESIEGVSDEIDGDDQFDQSSRNLTGDYFCLGFFFSEKGKVGGDFPSRKKKGPESKFLLDWLNWSRIWISLVSPPIDWLGHM